MQKINKNIRKVLMLLALLATIVGIGEVSAVTHSDYYGTSSARTSGISITSSSEVNKNYPIPAEYTFSLGNDYSSATGSGAIALTSSQKESWASIYPAIIDYYDECYWTNASSKSDVAGKFSMLYKNVGEYNGQAIDVKLTVQDYEAATTGLKYSSQVPIIGFFTTGQELGIWVARIHWIQIKYEFYKSGTTTPVNGIKGYTGYYDVDVYQGVHLLDNNTGIYATNDSRLSYTKVEGKPYVYAHYYKDYPEGYITEASFFETFNTGSGNTMNRTFTFSGTRPDINGIEYPNMYFAEGLQYHDAVVNTAKKNYSKTSRVRSESTQVDVGSQIEYEIQATNGSETSSTVVKVEDTLSKGLKYVNNSAKIEVWSGNRKISESQVNPTPSSYIDTGQTLTWSSINVAAGQSIKLKYKVEVTQKAVTQVKNGAKVTIGGHEYDVGYLRNPVKARIEINYASDNGGTLVGEPKEQNLNPGDKPSGRTTTLNTGYCKRIGWKIDKAVTLENGTTKAANSTLTDAEVKQVVLTEANNGMTFTAIHQQCVTINYASDQGGTLTGIDKEENIPIGTNPQGSSRKFKSGYCEFKGWKIDKAVTLNDGTTKEVNSILTNDQVKQVKLTAANNGMTFTAIHTACPGPYKKVSSQSTITANQPVKKGEFIIYEIGYINTKDADGPVTITDTLTGLEYVEIVSQTGSATVAKNGNVVTFTEANAPGVNSTGGRTMRTITYKVKVTDDGTLGAVSNNATVKVNGDTPTPTTKIENPVPVKKYDAASTIKAVGEKAEKGQIITYNIKYKNTTNKTQTIVVTDELSKGLKYKKTLEIVGGTTKEPQKEVNNDTGVTKLTWSREVPAGVTEEIRYTVEVTGTTTLVNNNAKTTYTDPARTINVGSLYNPVPVKEWSVDSPSGLNGEVVQKGSIIEYSIKYSNPYGSAKKITIKDIPSEGLEYVKGSAKIDGVATEPQDPNAKTLVWELASVPAHASGELLLKFKVVANTVLVNNKATIKYDNGSEIDLDEPTNPNPYKDYSELTKYGKGGAAVKEGYQITYAIHYANALQENVTIQAEDNLYNLEYISGTSKVKIGNNYAKINDPTITQGENGRTKLVWEERILEPLEEETIEYTVKVLGKDVYVENGASTYYNGSKHNLNKLQNPVPIKTYAANSSVHKVDEYVKKGDIIRYSIKFKNTKDTETIITIADVLSKGLEWVSSETPKLNGKNVSSTIESKPNADSPTTLLWVEKLQPGQTYELTYSAKVTGETTIVENNATVMFEGDDPIGLDILRNPLEQIKTVPVPNTASLVSKIALAAGLILICAGGVVLFRRNQH